VPDRRTTTRPRRCPQRRRVGGITTGIAGVSLVGAAGTVAGLNWAGIASGLLLGQAVQLVYTCWDRIVLNGYIERLQRPENLIHFFHDVVGVACIEPAVLEQRTNACKAWVRRITEEQNIPILAAPRGVRKEQLGWTLLPTFQEC
jgi:hypothetical protein